MAASVPQLYILVLISAFGGYLAKDKGSPHTLTTVSYIHQSSFFGLWFMPPFDVLELELTFAEYLLVMDPPFNFPQE